MSSKEIEKIAKMIRDLQTMQEEAAQKVKSAADELMKKQVAVRAYLPLDLIHEIARKEFVLSGYILCQISHEFHYTEVTKPPIKTKFLTGSLRVCP